MDETIAIIVGAGRGSRFGGDIPKQYQSLGGEAIIRRTLRAFADHPGVSSVLPVINFDDLDLFESAAAGLTLRPAVAGGETRQESVRRGLESLAPTPPEKVLIHDAARPFVSHQTISSVIETLDEFDGAVPALPVTDTLKRGDAGKITKTVPRAGLFRVQTPQGFRFNKIFAAHKDLAGMKLTDDAAVAEQAGLVVRLVTGNEENIKVTTQQDLEKSEKLISGGETRTGTGFDVHRFCEGSTVTLCGVEIPHDKGLLGHSDADAALHALTDALLGAIGAGDIGMHFPPSDPQWRGAPSDVFAKHACSLIRQKGGRIVSVDITIICERPKIGPHRAKMIRRLGEILELGRDRISVKGTTSEGLGFTGRGEGIAAQSIATVLLP